MCVYPSHWLSHVVPLHSPRGVPGRSVQGLEPHFQPALTHVGDVQREPEEEGVADQLGEEQAQRELDHALEERG